MKNILGFLLQFSIHTKKGVAKFILISMRTERCYVRKYNLIVRAYLFLECIYNYKSRHV